MDSEIGSGVAGSPPTRGGGVTAAVSWLLDIEAVLGWFVLSCQACRDSKSLFLRGALRLRRAAGLPFGLFSLLMAEGCFSFCVLPGTTTENCVWWSGGWVHCAPSASFHVSSIDFVFDQTSGFGWIRAGFPFHPDAFRVVVGRGAGITLLQSLARPLLPLLQLFSFLVAIR